MTTYELFLCWIIATLLVLVVGEATTWRRSNRLIRSPHCRRPLEHEGPMKRLPAVIAVLCLSSTVLAHDIYSNLRDRDGHLCCNGQDCRPVQAMMGQMAITTYRILARLFPPIWQHHRLMIASTIVVTIQCCMCLIR
jgi:hypothetical protein